MNIINLPENASSADFAAFVESGEVIGDIATAQNGSKYIQGAVGQFSEGQSVVQFVRVFAGEGRRSNWKFVGFRKDVVGTISGAGKSFIVRTKEDAMLAGETNPVDVYNVRYYL